MSRRSLDSEDPVEDRDRKAEHIELALEERMQNRERFFDRLRFDHVALPELDRSHIDLSTEFLDKPLRAPLLISCMTGGTEEAARINRNLARAAESTGVALGVGSQRKALEDPSQVSTFQVRDQAPGIPLLANLGAVQLNYGYGIEECRRAVEMIEADALVFHLNALQEAIQPEGQCDFSSLLPKIGTVAAELEVPVIAKEIGCGLDRATGEALVAQGVRILDSAGRGGTSWARIEGARSADASLGDLFGEWGIPTPTAIRELREIPGVTVIGSGGLRTGLHAAKALALGADLVGMAQPFLEPALESPEAVGERIRRILTELEVAMFCLGCRRPSDLRLQPLREVHP
ncbi:MAG: type 2 isopentenyl-diphosphate Delta-isomerase [Thermoanaerobaculia bacterium]|nr:type 2 isopentenyl-diphosphate Delta-isomerase [Thermoanaerobaculia bacterium]